VTVIGLVTLNLATWAADQGWLGTAMSGVLGDLDLALIARLALPVAGLILIENLVRNSPRDALWSAKFLFVALGVMWAYDLVVDSNALLFRRLDPELLAARGAIQVLIVPLLAVAAARNPAWSIEIGVSRGAVFHSAALMGSGLFLLLMASAGYYLRQVGGSWGPLLQVTFLAAAGMLLGIVVASGRVRGQLRVFINKHFFSYKYDYRLEWHRFIDALAGPGRDGPLHERVIEAVADILDSPGGAIWLRPVGASTFAQAATWNFPTSPEFEPAEGEFVRHLATSERIIVVPPAPIEQQAEIALPAWLTASKDAWLVVPLRHRDGLLGFLVLRRPRARRSLDWEDWDLLRTVGRQAASYLAEQAAIQTVADARQLEAFNRRFAFVVHDLKNLVSPLALTLANAAHHGDDPAFQHDMIATIGDSVARMKRMLSELGAEPRARRASGPVPIAALLERVARERASPALRTEPPDGALAILADADLMAVALGHLVQNAIEAVRGIGHVILRATLSGGRVVIEVEDDGPGMTAAFVRDELFRPLTTTKASGYGIGAFQARELVREMGGQLDVASTQGVGTTVRIGFPPYHAEAAAPPLAPVGASRA
ncbi:MAG: PEP-CTERM system histidine kinase PrsK, partial [Alphaproteobacteria bacterium]|nr:PEP-CTERM system histidine kinase PrsK [Alphaproteobacteria bacterium]